MPNDKAKLHRLMRRAHVLQKGDEDHRYSKRFALIKAWWFESFREDLFNGFARFTYRKKDGKFRTALGTLAPSLIPVDKLEKGYKVGEAASENEGYKTFTYFDLDKNEWRSFKILNFVCFDKSWRFNDPMRNMETVICENCGKELLKSEATYYEDADLYFCPDCAKECLTTCERCGAVIAYDDSYQGYNGYLCECCHDELFD